MDTERERGLRGMIKRGWGEELGKRPKGGVWKGGECGTEGRRKVCRLHRLMDCDKAGATVDSSSM